MLSHLILKIKRKDTSFYSFLYNVAKSLKAFNLPCVRPVHLPLYYFDCFVKRTVRWAIHKVWSEPLFRARCQVVGKDLSLPNGIPYVIGSHLKICLGDNVKIMRSTIGASKVFDQPVLKVGNNSHIGYGTIISVSRRIVIGDNCLIGPHCLIMDSDDHPINPEKRLRRETVEKKNVLAVNIGNNVWLGGYCAILKGVTIGDNSVIAAHSVVTKDVTSNCVYAGSPARAILRDIDKL